MQVAVMSERANLLYHLWTDFTALQWTLTAKPSTQLTHQQRNNCVPNENVSYLFKPSANLPPQSQTITSVLTAVFHANLGYPVPLGFLPLLVLEENLWA